MTADRLAAAREQLAAAQRELEAAEAAAAGSRATCYLAIDPGQTGAAVLLADDGLTVLWCRRWKNADAADLDLAVPSDALVFIEKPFEDPRHPSAAMAIERWVGALRLPAAIRVTARTWRRVLGRGASQLRRDDAKAAAMAAARRHAIGLSAEDLASPDACEAWLMARWLWSWDRAGRPQLEKPKARRRRAKRVAA